MIPVIKAFTEFIGMVEFTVGIVIETSVNDDEDTFAFVVSGEVDVGTDIGVVKFDVTFTDMSASVKGYEDEDGVEESTVVLSTVLSDITGFDTDLEEFDVALLEFVLDDKTNVAGLNKLCLCVVVKLADSIEFELT